MDRVSEQKEKNSLVEDIENFLKTDSRHASAADVACGFIEQITGGSETTESFHGQMMQLREAEKVQYLLFLKAIVDRKMYVLKRDDPTNDDIELYKGSSKDAQYALDAVDEAERKMASVRFNPLVIAPDKNTLNQEADIKRSMGKLGIAI